MRKTIFVLFTLTISIYSYAAQYSIITGNQVQVRKYPDLNSEVIQVLHKNQKIEVIQRLDFVDEINHQKNNWYEVSIEDGEGWVFGAYIDTASLDLEELPKDSKIGFFIGNGLLDDILQIEDKEVLVQKLGKPQKINKSHDHNKTNAEKIGDVSYQFIYPEYEVILIDNKTRYLFHEFFLKKKSLKVLWDLNIGQEKKTIIKTLGKPDPESDLNHFIYNDYHASVEFEFRNNKVFKIKWVYLPD